MKNLVCIVLIVLILLILLLIINKFCLNKNSNFKDNILNSLNLNNKFKEIKKKKILFIYENKNKTINFDTILNGINGGSEYVMFFLAKNLVHNFNIYIHDPKSNKNYIQNNINFVNYINEKDYDIIIDSRDTKRNNFIKDTKYIVHHHDHLEHLNNINKFKKFNDIITISNSQYNLWNKKLNYKYKNLHIINNPFLDENIHRNYKYNPFKIISFASKTNFNKLFKIFDIIYKLDNRYKLYISSPNYRDISKLKINNKNIININNLKHSDMLNFLKDSFVFLYPTDFCESYGCVFDECLYYGVPIITDYVKNSRINELENEIGVYIFKNKNNNEMANLIHSWNINNNRPIIRWNHNNEKILNQWIKLLNKN